ncbi:HTH_Tnp_Tc3_2 domain-containing protein [Trichonephila clavipes]|nr:HTH_Tnp_Tc3_2 domain-containing protein [Trichonephila clavipes]
MPLIMRRSHYQQLTEFEPRSCNRTTKKVDSPYAVLQKDLAGRCMIVGSSGQGMVLSQKVRVPGGHVPLLRPELIGRWSGDLLRFLMKSGSALVPVMAVCWSEGGRGNACNQTVSGLDTLDQHLESWSGKQFPMTAGAISWLSQTR